MQPAAGSERRSPPGPAVPPPPPRGHAPLAAAPGPLSSPAREPPQPEEERQLRISESGQFSDGLEDRGLLESSTRLKPHEAQNYRKKALWVSWFSIIVTLALAVAAFTVSVMRYSASAFGFAFDAILDVLSSAIVLWRYSNAAAVHSAHREYIKRDPLQHPGCAEVYAGEGSDQQSSHNRWVQLPRGGRDGLLHPSERRGIQAQLGSLVPGRQHRGADRTHHIRLRGQAPHRHGAQGEADAPL
uniref:Transmembrane protein 163 n=1 Tax=Sus scrofa TaxID=9823 RepID=A0A8D1Z294_PIG